ncbi:MAG: DMT family transporter [Gemmobacter sp.]
MTEVAGGGRTLAGIGLGLIAVTGWAYYNVGTELARAEGFRPADLAALRFGVGALVLLPCFVLARGWRLPQRRLMLFALIVGPPFALLFNTGFQLAPLSHAVVIGPGMSVLVALALVRFVDGQRMPPLRLVGLALLMAGLVAIGADRADTGKASGLPAVLGDLCFVATGSLWGLFSWLLARWRLPPVQAAAGLALYSAAVFLPAWFVVWGVPELSAAAWAHQAVAQGLIGGSGAPVAFAAALAILGAGRGSVFNALVPPAAVLMAMPVAGILPNPLQWAGVALASTGLVLSMAVGGMRRNGSEG